MRELVLDASVIIKWFTVRDENGSEQAEALRQEYQRGGSAVICPSLMFLEVINVVGRSWREDEASLLKLAARLDRLAFEIDEPELPAIAIWVARGLTAYDAAYVAIAEKRNVPLVSDDSRILAVAGNLALPLCPSPP